MASEKAIGDSTAATDLGRYWTDSRSVPLCRPKMGNDAAPPFTLSHAGSAAMSLQGSIEAADQGGSGEGLRQEANCSGLQRSSADAVIGEGRDENKRGM